MQCCFEEGLLKLSISEPQIIKLLADGKNALIIYICAYGEEKTDKISGFLQNETELENQFECAASYIYPAKVYVENAVFYYPSVVKLGKVYLASSVYSGQYSGKNKVRVNGEYYIAIEEFIGNGNFKNCVYDASLGIIRVTPVSDGDSYAVKNFKNCSSAVGSVALDDGATFERISEGYVGIYAELTDHTLLTAKCLKLSVDLVMSGSDVGVPISISIVCRKANGDIKVVSNVVTRCYKTLKNNIQYFDLTSFNDVYEGCYLVISTEADSGISISAENITLMEYKSSGFADNEFNPFD